MAGGFSMAATKAMSDSPGSFMSGMEMSRISQDMMNSGTHQEYGGGDSDVDNSQINMDV